MEEPQGRSRAHACEVSRHVADAPLSGKNFAALTIIDVEAVCGPDRLVTESGQTIRDLRIEAIAERDGHRRGPTCTAEVR